MCGIAGFSLSPDSKVKVRKLANSLLTSIEDRGYMASGYAYQSGSDMGYYKQAVTGSQLSLKRLPKNARHVILHTRLATHGSTSDNRNNHPVMSPSENIALVHNGVIYNHQQVRRKIDGDLPDVDTSVIPAVIEQLGIDSLDELDGDAAIAWFDRKQHNTLHLARYQHSPLVMCQIEDGSFIFASTEKLLWQTLVELDLMPTWMETAKELEYFTIRDGVVLSSSKLPAPKFADSRYDYSYYRHQTSGAKGSTTSKGIEPSYVPGFGWDDWYDEDDYYTYNSPRYEYESPSCNVVTFTEDEDKYVESIKTTTYTNTRTPSIRERQAKWYTQIKDNRTNEVYTLYYMDGESEVWKDELWLMSDDGQTILEYGRVTADGELHSQVDELF